MVDCESHASIYEEFRKAALFSIALGDPQAIVLLTAFDNMKGCVESLILLTAVEDNTKIYKYVLSFLKNFQNMSPVESNDGLVSKDLITMLKSKLNWADKSDEMAGKLINSIAKCILVIRQLIGLKKFNELIFKSSNTAVVNEKITLKDIAPKFVHDEFLRQNDQDRKLRELIKSNGKHGSIRTGSGNEIHWTNFNRDRAREIGEKLFQVETAPVNEVVELKQEVIEPEGSGIAILVDLATTIKNNFQDHEMIMSHLFSLLKSKRTSDDLQSDLLDLFGFDNFEIMTSVLSNRDALIKAEEQSEHSRLQKVQHDSMMRNSAMQVKSCLVNSNFSVNSKTDIKMQKESLKLKKKLEKEIKNITGTFGDEEKMEIQLATKQSLKNFNDMMDADFGDFDSSIQAALSREANMRYPFVFSDSATKGRTSMMMSGYRMVLPEGSVRKDMGTYEEVTIPAASVSDKTKGSFLSSIKRLDIADMDPSCALGFKNFKSLNAIQSIVYEQAYKTNENLLICAPTGAGKTNIAMLTIMKTISDNMDPDGTIRKGEFKVIYICPMKALAAEMTESFGKRLAPLGLTVRELTGDTNLTKKEMDSTNMLILTPEKWDVISRKNNASDDGAGSLNTTVKLMIIDEVHLLNDERGAVIEAIVARVFREMIIGQKKIRMVGLSATLPNYKDAAEFLQVDKFKGMFVFDDKFRPVPLQMHFIGVKKQTGPSLAQINALKQAKADARDNNVLPDRIAATLPADLMSGGKGRSTMNTEELLDFTAYQKAVSFASKKQQVLVFVHSRNGTWKLADAFREFAATRNQLEDFLVENIFAPDYVAAKKKVDHLRNPRLMDVFCLGFGVHHAGMPRSERLCIENMFLNGYINVLFCTATLAWGVNLPATAVIIRGTDVFDSSKGAMGDLSTLDVQQIFGRSGRPQFNETLGYGVIISHHSKMDKYLAMLSHSTPIESQFMSKIGDNLNAEIARGSVTSVREAVNWIKNTFYYIRAKKNPLVYGILNDEVRKDPNLEEHLMSFVMVAARKLDTLQMINYDHVNGFLSPTDLGRIASNFYVSMETMEVFLGVNNSTLNELNGQMEDDEILAFLCESSEFKSLKVRDDDVTELCNIQRSSSRFEVGSNMTFVSGKVNVLLQAYISRYSVRNFTLNGETLYIVQNAPRLARALFEIALKKGWAYTTVKCLALTRCIENKMWYTDCPLRQLSFLGFSETILQKIEQRNLSFYELWDMSEQELTAMLRVDAKKVYDGLRMLPMCEVEATVKPITHSIIQMKITLKAMFYWNDRILGKQSSTQFWLFIENVSDNRIIHHEIINYPRKTVIDNDTMELIVTVPINENETTDNFQVRLAHNYFLIEDYCYPVSMHNCVFPISNMAHTDLLELDPLPIKALKNEKYESIYKFEYFNPIQTQVFFKLYHTSAHILIGAPTGSGKTLCAELAIFNTLNKDPKKKIVYIAPLKALVRERVEDWKEKLGNKVGVNVVEVSGDYTPNGKELDKATVLVTTPEKWDCITRSWETRSYVKKVDCVIIDEIHLLGVERGAVLEAIITRLKIINEKRVDQNNKAISPCRIVGLSTALANAGDVAEWLGVRDGGLFNFRPSVRPVPITCHIAGFPGIHYCPRMALMNKPAFNSIKTYSPKKPVLIFVASRRQTRITAQSFIPLLSMEDDVTQWNNMNSEELDLLLDTVQDEFLRMTLPFGIGMHHAGLTRYERALVERLFVEKKIQVLVTTATLAWGINCPAHLVIVKGTEYFDGKKGRYVDFPVTDVMQMIGRAGRPQFDTSAVAVIYCQDIKKNFYKNFLHQPFPVESSFLDFMPNHINAEICAGIVKNKQEVIDYLSKTYFYRRLFNNPSYYGIEETSGHGLVKYLIEKVDDACQQLLDSGCIQFTDFNKTSIKPTAFGKLSSKFYLQHTSIRHMIASITSKNTVEELLQIFADIPEFAEIPVRHNEDIINEELSKQLPLKVKEGATFDSSHTKVFLMYQAHFGHIKLPVDYKTDLKSCLDACARIVQAMYEYCVITAYTETAANMLTLQQMILEGKWHNDTHVKQKKVGKRKNNMPK